MIRNHAEFRSVPISAGLLMRCFRPACLLVSLVTGVVNGQKYTVPEPVPVSSDLLVGCYYFPGYFNVRRWEPIARFGHPFPLRGFYRDSEPEIADWHIKWAVEHGSDFFAFDWYCDYKTGHVRNHNAALEQGFLNARYRE